MYLFNLLAEDFRGAPDIFWGVFTFVLGLIIVFAGMAILVLVVSLVAKVMTAKAKKKETAEETETVEAVTETTVEEDGIPESVRVAIMAAVLAYYEGEGVKNEFVVKKIKKLNY